MKLHLLACLILVVTISGYAAGDDRDKMFKKYGMIKVFESCFGEEYMKMKMAQRKMAAMRCKNMPMTRYLKSSSSFGSSFDSTRGDFGSSSWSSRKPSGSNVGMFNRNKDGAHGVPFRSSSRPASIPNFPISLQGIDWSNILPQSFKQNENGITYVPVPIIIPGDKIRQKRQASSDFQYYDREMVDGLMEKTEAMVSNKTCILQEIGYITENLEINTNFIRSEIRKLNVERELQEDLVETLEDCSGAVNCMPFNPKKFMFPPEMKKIKMFMKCTIKKNLMACMKKDLRKKSSSFDINALGGILPGADDDEKMLALVWAKSTYGDDMDF